MYACSFVARTAPWVGGTALLLLFGCQDQAPEPEFARVGNRYQLRVSGKKKDDLQTVIALLRNADLDVALQFVNYR